MPTGKTYIAIVRDHPGLHLQLKEFPLHSQQTDEQARHVSTVQDGRKRWTKSSMIIIATSSLVICTVKSV